MKAFLLALLAFAGVFSPPGEIVQAYPRYYRPIIDITMLTAIMAIGMAVSGTRVTGTQVQTR